MPVAALAPSPETARPNLSKTQSFSYRSQSCGAAVGGGGRAREAPAAVRGPARKPPPHAPPPAAPHPRPQALVHRVHSKRLPGRRGVPERDGHVVARRDAPRVGATPRPPAPAAHPARVRDRPNDLGEERARAGGVGRGHGERGAVARRRRAEVAQPEHALARRVAKQGAVRGWNSAVVTTSVRSSMRGGLRSTSVYGGAAGASRCQRLTRRSSADRNVSPSEQRDSELTW